MKIGRIIVAGITAFTLALASTPVAGAYNPADTNIPDTSISTDTNIDTSADTKEAEIDFLVELIAGPDALEDAQIRQEVQDLMDWATNIPESVQEDETALTQYFETNPAPLSGTVEQWIHELISWLTTDPEEQVIEPNSDGSTSASEFGALIETMGELSYAGDPQKQLEADEAFNWFMNIPDEVIAADMETFNSYLETNPAPETQSGQEMVTNLRNLYQEPDTKTPQNSDTQASLKKNNPAESNAFVPRPVLDGPSDGNLKPIPNKPKPSATPSKKPTTKPQPTVTITAKQTVTITAKPPKSKKSLTWWVGTSGKCLAEAAPYIAAGGAAALAAKIPKVISTLNKLKTSKKVADAIKQVGGVKEAGRVLFKHAMQLLKNELNKHPQLKPLASQIKNIGLNAKEKLAAATLWGFIVNNIWEAFGLGSCGAIVNELTGLG